MAIRHDADLPQFVFDHQIDPFVQGHVGFRLKESGSVGKFQTVTSLFYDSKINHVMTDLKGWASGVSSGLAN